MKKISLKFLLLVASVGLLGVSQVEAATDYSDALAFGARKCRRGGCKSVASSYKPYDLCETGHPEVSENELLLQLDPASRQIYNNLGPEGQALARDLAGDNYRSDKNHAVKAAREMMLDRRYEQNGLPKQAGGVQTYNQGVQRNSQNTSNVNTNTNVYQR